MSPTVRKIKRPEVKDLASDDPAPWWSTSERLMKAARIIWPRLEVACFGSDESSKVDMDLFAGFFLLAGFAVENALKARILARARADPAQRRVHSVLTYFGRPREQHILTLLAVRADLSLSGTEARLLERLTQYTLWGARYPLPKNPTVFRRDTRDRDLKEIDAFVARCRRR